MMRDALIARYKADIAAAKATMAVLQEGRDAAFLDAMDRQIDTMTQAQAKLATTKELALSAATWSLSR